MEIKFTSSVIFVSDIDVSRRFYEEQLGQTVLVDHGVNIGFDGGFAIWQSAYANQVIFGESQGETLGHKNFELYFETDDLDALCQRVEQAGIPMVHPLHEQPWGQRVIRLYDPDRHIIEIGEPMPVVILRFLAQGLTADEIAQRTFMPVGLVRQLIDIASGQGLPGQAPA